MQFTDNLLYEHILSYEGSHANHFWQIEFQFKLAAEVQIKYDLAGSTTFLISVASQPQKALLIKSNAPKESLPQEGLALM